MGTQFYWFYDVMTIALIVGICYAVIAKGFNKVVFQLAAFLVAAVVGVTGANLLAPRVYQDLFQEKVIQTAEITLTDENFDIYQRVSENFALTAGEGEKTPDAEALHKKLLAVKNQEKPTFEDWFTEAVCNVIEQRVNETQKLHYISSEQTRLSACMQSQPPKALRDMLLCFEEESTQDLTESIRSCIEPVYCTNYTQLVRLALFLVIELVILIICCIIAMMTSHVEQTMHLRRGDHALAVPVALVETAVLLLVICVTVRLIAQLTDDQMLLFNTPTIDETFLFKHIYRVQALLFGEQPA